MSWTTVNVTIGGSLKLQNVQNGDHNSVKPVKSVASKFRVNILHNAEKLIGSWPKRKRRASNRAPTEPISKKLKRSQGNKVEINALPVGKTDFDEKPASPKRRSVRLQTPSAENLCDLPSADYSDMQACASGPHPPAHLQQATIKNTPTRVVIDPDRVEALSKLDSSSSADASGSPMEVRHPLALCSQDEPVNEISSDESSTNFDQFDDSVFDESFRTFLEAETSSSSTISPDTPVIATSPASDKPSREKQNQPSIAQAAVKRSKQAPCAPFMHPCLLDSLQCEALILNKKDAATPSLKHTCFRAAELLRLSKCFSSSTAAQDSDLTAELFATVKEVQYANSQGQGQGLVLADVFFPDKQPFIIASSRIPYIARTWISQSQSEGELNNPVKATIKVSRSSSSLASRPTQSRSSPVNPSQAASDKGLHAFTIPAFEVTEVHTSS